VGRVALVVVVVVKKLQRIEERKRWARCGGS
jgi:hypothetical protein